MPAASDHFRNGRFFNPSGANGQPFTKVPGMLFERGAPWPREVAVTPRRPPTPQPGEVVITFIGHATFLIGTSAGHIITDPVFAQRAGPLQLAGPRRVRQPGVRFDELPGISLVLLSHNHYDHCDLTALRNIHARPARHGAPYALKPAMVTLLGNASLVRKTGLQRIDELDWWSTTSAAPNATITATPAQHFSARTPFDRNKALWGGFVIEVAGQRIYFAGDSGYGPHFREIGRRLGPFDLALIPIGAYEPRWFMKDIHMNPEEAVQAHLDVGARRSIGMHFGTFRLTTEAIDEPVQALARARAAKGISDAEFGVLDVGGSLTLG